MDIMHLDLGNLLIPIASSLVGLIPVLITLLVGWFENRSQTARVNRILQQTNQQVSFLTTWFNLQKDVCIPAQLPSIKLTLSDELNDVYELFMDAMLDADKESKQRREVINQYRKTSPFRRALLIYRPYNARGWIFHTLYYMCILPMLVTIGYIIYQFVQTRVWMAGLPDETLMVAGGALLLIIVFRFMGRDAAKGIEERMIKLDQKTSPLRVGTAAGD